MRRRLHSLLTILSLMLCILWVVGSRRTVDIGLGHDGRWWSIGVGDGVLMVSAATPRSGDTGWSLRLGDGVPLPVRAASRWFYAGYLGGWDGWAAAAPMWFVVTTLLIVGVINYRFRRHVPAGDCPACGYNLTGNVSGTCPECGTPSEQAAP